MTEAQANQQEKLSALADGELHDDEWAQTLNFAASEQGRETWQLYQLVGDVLRSPELARHSHDDGAFLAKLRQGLAQESTPIATATTTAAAPKPTPAAPAPTPATFQPATAANDSVFRWKLLAGVASLATVATLAWSSWSASNAPAEQQWATLAAPSAVTASATTATTAVSANPNHPRAPVMLRDPRLDELVAAHQQFHGPSALQLPANFLRNANFESPKR